MIWMIQRTFGQVLDRFDAFILVMLSLCSRNMHPLVVQVDTFFQTPCLFEFSSITLWVICT